MVNGKKAVDRAHTVMVRPARSSAEIPASNTGIGRGVLLVVASEICLRSRVCQSTVTDQAYDCTYVWSEAVMCMLRQEQVVKLLGDNKVKQFLCTNACLYLNC